MKWFLRRTKESLYLFALLGMILIPLHLRFFSFQDEWANILLGKEILFLTRYFTPGRMGNPAISSDSFSFYWMMGLLALAAFLFSLLFHYRWKSGRKQKFLLLIRSATAYYLSFQLLRYGTDKIFKLQFYQPEPNILYTPFGAMGKDILYWSTMGTSYSYNLFLGSMEAIAGLLLLFRRTRTTGSILALFILGNVVAVNFSFDISVKILSSFLLFLSMLHISPQLDNLYRFFIKGEKVQLTTTFPEVLGSPRMNSGLTLLVSAFLLLEVFYPTVRSGKWNDDRTERPFLHGAYEIIRKGDSLGVHKLPFRRFFIHRDGYLIFQDNRDRMKDYKLSINSNRFILTDYYGKSFYIPYRQKDSLLELRFPGDEEYIMAKSLNWKDLPALKPSFHWAVDDYQD